MFCMLCYQDRSCEEMYPKVLVCSGCRRDVRKILNFLKSCGVEVLELERLRTPAEVDEVDRSNGVLEELPVPAKDRKK